MNSTQAMTMIVNDLCDAMERVVDRANAFGTGLGRAEAPEPDKPSRPFGCHPISQENTREPGCSNKAPGSNSDVG